MRLGLVGWPSETGLGMELRDAIRYLPAQSVFFMNHVGKPMAPEWKKKTVGEYDLPKKMAAWVSSEKIDTVLTWETPGDWSFPALWERLGVRWFCMIHWDWFAPKQMEAWKRAKLLVPFHSAALGLRMVYGLESTGVPVPVDLERLPFVQRKRAERFTMTYGMGGPGDRRAIRATIEAWRLLGKEAPPLVINAQKQPPELDGVEIPPSVKLQIGVMPKPSDLYSAADVAVMPSRYEGVGLSLIEAQACGLPVVTSNLDPMRSIAPDHLVNGQLGDLEVMEGHKVGTISPDPGSIAARVKDLAYRSIEDESLVARRRVDPWLSWASIRDQWIKVLETA